MTNEEKIAEIGQDNLHLKNKADKSLFLEALDKAHVEGRVQGFKTGYIAGESTQLAKKKEQVRKLKKLFLNVTFWEKWKVDMYIDEIFPECVEKDKI